MSLVLALNPPPPPSLVSSPSFTPSGSRHSRWTISSHWEAPPSHCGSVRWGSYLSSLNVSKRIGNQWCMPLRENFSLNLISPPPYLFAHLSLLLFLLSFTLVLSNLSFSFKPWMWRWARWGGGKAETVAFRNYFGLVSVTGTVVWSCPDFSVLFSALAAQSTISRKVLRTVTRPGVFKLCFQAVLLREQVATNQSRMLHWKHVARWRVAWDDPRPSRFKNPPTSRLPPSYFEFYSSSHLFCPSV